MTIAALFVDPRGHYPKMPEVECWTQERDARLYTGPHSVVAHPPCQLWVNLAAVNFKRYGGEHNRPGNDGGCFRYALKCVQKYGGVLKHPAFSNAWREYGLPPPPGIGWYTWGEQQWVCEVWQSAYGHLARKRTWLFYSGRRAPAEANWKRKAGTHQVGWFDRNKPTLGKKAASETPLLFAEYLVGLARNAA